MWAHFAAHFSAFLLILIEQKYEVRRSHSPNHFIRNTHTHTHRAFRRNECARIMTQFLEFAREPIHFRCLLVTAAAVVVLHIHILSHNMDHAFIHFNLILVFFFKFGFSHQLLEFFCFSFRIFNSRREERKHRNGMQIVKEERDKYYSVANTLLFYCQHYRLH